MIWTFCRTAINKNLKGTHKRALRILYNDYSVSFEALLHTSNECTIHTKHLQMLMLDVHKCTSNQNQSFLLDAFHEKSDQYDFISKNLLILPQTNTFRNILFASINFSFSIFCSILFYISVIFADSWPLLFYLCKKYINQF